MIDCYSSICGVIVASLKDITRRTLNGFLVDCLALSFGV